jgi:hypothetical protein
MTTPEITTLVTALQEALIPYINKLVQDAVREVPFTVQKEFFRLTQGIAIDEVREAVRKRISIIISTKEG